MSSRERWNMLLAFTAGDEELATHVMRLCQGIDFALEEEGVATVGGPGYGTIWDWESPEQDLDWDN